MRMVGVFVIRRFLRTSCRAL